VTRAKVRIDQASLTFAELADIEEELGTSLSALFEKSQARGMAALVWITVRRTDPAFSFDDALQYGPGDLDNVDADPEALAANNGGALHTSPASGDSTPVT